MEELIQTKMAPPIYFLFRFLSQETNKIPTETENKKCMARLYEKCKLYIIFTSHLSMGVEKGQEMGDIKTRKVKDISKTIKERQQ
jgi:hypothetical protein